MVVEDFVVRVVGNTGAIHGIEGYEVLAVGIEDRLDMEL